MTIQQDLACAELLGWHRSCPSDIWSWLDKDGKRVGPSDWSPSGNLIHAVDMAEALGHSTLVIKYSNSPKVPPAQVSAWIADFPHHTVKLQGEIKSASDASAAAITNAVLAAGGEK